MIVAGVQLDIAWEDPPENFRRVEERVAAAVAEGARLVVLPEMFATGFSMRAGLVARHADETRKFLGRLAHRHGVFVAGGYADPAEGRPRNACSILGPDGEELARYHKIHPFSLVGEDQHYQGGDQLVTVTLEGLRVTPLVCYDLRFPEVFRAAATATDLFLVIANWPRIRRDPWRVLLRARAVESQVFVLGVNRVGQDAAGVPHSGDSALLDPQGQTLGELTGDEGLVLGAVEAQEVARVRERFSFLADRRPEVYARLG